MQRVILNVAEKPSVAKSISQILGSHYKVEDTASVYNKLYRFNYNVMGQASEMLFTSVTGHLMSLKYHDKYKNWNDWDPAVILSQAELQKYIANEKKQLHTNLTRFSRQADTLILWLDCDREGENIAFEVIDVCKESNRNLTIYRAHFSALTKADITKALNNLREPDKSLSDSVEARQEIDLRIGASFTRFQTLLIRRCYSLQGVISYGPCQFPTLGFVVNRHREIEEFKSENYWFIHCVCENSEFIWNRGKLFSEFETLVFFEACFTRAGTVKDVKKKEVQKYKPLPLATIEFEKLATKKLRISAQKAMEVAEKLYNQGYISYPRTETNKFPKTMNIKELVERQMGSQQWGEFARDLIEYGGFGQPRGGSKDDFAHPPIHPVKLMSRSENELEFKIYELITRHFLAVCSKNAEGEETTIRLEVKEEEFHAKGLVVTQENYLKVYPYDQWSEAKVPAVQVGQEVGIELSVRSGCTSAPPYLTETELIKLMDRHGIGTDATIHEHIMTIQDREYAKKTGQIFKPTRLGIALVETYRALGFSLHLPELRARMEENMNKVAAGGMDKDRFVLETVKEMEVILKELQRKKADFSQLIGHHLQQLSNYDENADEAQVVKKKEMGSCIKCQRLMEYQELGDGSKHLLCSFCSTKFKLPFDGEPVYRPQTCPMCAYHVVEIQKANNKSYVICPHCYNSPPDDFQIPDRMPCFTCKFDNCQFSSYSKQVGTPYNCRLCKKAMQIRKTKKNTLFVGCSQFPKCSSSAFLPDQIQMAQITDKRCPKCQDKAILSYLVKISFRDDELRFGSLLMRAQDIASLYCLYPQCDEDLGDLIKWSGNSNYNQQSNTQQQQQQQQQSQQQRQQQQQPQRENSDPNQNTSGFNQDPSQKFQKYTCFKCGEKGHFANQCPNKANNNENNQNNDYKQKKYKANNNNNNNYQKKKKGCYYCGVVGRHPKDSECEGKNKKNKKE